MYLAVPYILGGMGSWAAPDRLAGLSRQLFAFTVGQSVQQACIGKPVNHRRGSVVVHGFFLSLIEVVVDDTYLLIVEQNLVQLGFQFYGILRNRRSGPEGKREAGDKNAE